MAGLTWNAETGLAEWDDSKETPTEMCDRLIEENNIGPRRGQAIASSVRSIVFTNIRKFRDIPLSIARRDLHEIVCADLECEGFRPELSKDEADIATYMFERMIEDGWHTLTPDGRPGVYVEPEFQENREQAAPATYHPGRLRFVLFMVVWAFCLMVKIQRNVEHRLEHDFTTLMMSSLVMALMLFGLWTVGSWMVRKTLAWSRA